MSRDLLARVFWISWWTYLLVVVPLKVVSLRALYGDGSSHFLFLLEFQNYIFQSPRQSALFLLQSPTLAAMNWLGVTNVNLLAYIYGLTYAVIPVVTSLLCWQILKKTKIASAILVPLLSIVVLDINNGFFMVSESHLLVGVFWVTFFYGLSLSEKVSWVQLLVISVLLFFGAFIYQFQVIMGVFLGGVLFYKAMAVEDPAKKWGLVVLAGLALLTAVMAGYWIVNAGNTSSGRDSFGQHLRWMFENPILWLTAILSLPFLWGLLRKSQPLEGGRQASTFGFIAAAAGLGLGLICFFYEGLLEIGLHYPARLLNLVVPLGLAGIVVWRPSFVERGLKPALLSYLVIFSLNLGWQASATMRWTQYIDQFHVELEEGTGVMPLETTRLGHSIFAWSWTHPTMSVVLHLLAERDITSVVKNTDGVYEPFYLHDPQEWPKVERYGSKWRIDPPAAH